MKKIWVPIFSILILTFIVITLTRNSSTENNALETTTVDSLRREELKNFWSVYRQATSLRIDGQWDQAIEFYQKALELNPLHEDAIYYLGNMFLESGKDEEAERTWLRLIELNPQSSRAHYQLGNLYMNSSDPDLKNLQKATEEFRTTFLINKDFLQPLMQLGQISLLLGDLDGSYEYFNTVLGSDKKNVASNYLCGYIMWKEGNPDKAFLFFNEACKNSRQEQPAKPASNEGDTKSGKSLERHINQSIFQSYFIDLPGLEEGNLTMEMDASYQKLDSFLTK